MVWLLTYLTSCFKCFETDCCVAKDSLELLILLPLRLRYWGMEAGAPCMLGKPSMAEPCL